MIAGLLTGGAILGGLIGGLDAALANGGRAALNAVETEVATQATEAVASEAAPSIDAILTQHMQTAVTKHQLTPAQAARILKNPRLEAAYRGDRIDALFKEIVAADSRLSHLEITPRFKFGPDVYDPIAQVWWDVTTSPQWAGHAAKYTPLFGRGVPLIYFLK